MKLEYKYQLSKSAVFDYRSVEKNLTKMAAKGWQLDHVGTFIWRFKPAEPAEKKFAVIFFNEKEFDPYQTEERQMLQDFCQSDGWHKVGEWQNMHIFEAEPDAPELETDEAVRLQGIKKVMNNRVVKNNLMALCLMIFLMFNSWRRHSQGDSDPKEILQQIWIMAFFIYAIVGFVLQMLGYFGWVKKSEKNIEQGRTCARAGWYSVLQDLFLLGIIPFTIGWMSAGSRELGAGGILGACAFIAAIMAVVAITGACSKSMREKGASATKNIVASTVLGVGCLLPIIIIAAIIMAF